LGDNYEAVAAEQNRLCFVWWEELTYLEFVPVLLALTSLFLSG